AAAATAEATASAAPAAARPTAPRAARAPRAAWKTAAAELRIGADVAQAMLFRQRVPEIRYRERAREHLRQHRRDQRAVHELRRHGVETLFLEPVAQVLEIRDALARELVRLLVALGGLRDARQVRADHGQLVDGHVVFRIRCAARAIAQRAHLLLAERVAQELRGFARQLVLAGRERRALVHQRLDLGVLLGHGVVDSRERL